MGRSWIQFPIGATGELSFADQNILKMSKQKKKRNKKSIKKKKALIKQPLFNLTIQDVNCKEMFSLPSYEIYFTKTNNNRNVSFCRFGGILPAQR